MVKVPETIPPEAIPIRELTKEVVMGQEQEEVKRLLMASGEQDRFNEKKEQEKKDFNQLIFDIQKNEAEHLAQVTQQLMSQWEEEKLANELEKQSHFEPSKEAEKASAATSKELRHEQQIEQRRMDEAQQKIQDILARYRELAQSLNAELADAQAALNQWKDQVWQPAIDAGKQAIFSDMDSPIKDLLKSDKLKEAAVAKLEKLPTAMENISAQIREKEAQLQTLNAHLQFISAELKNLKDAQLGGEKGLEFKIQLLEKNKDIVQDQFISQQLKLKSDLASLQGRLEELRIQKDKLEHFINPDHHSKLLDQLHANKQLEEKFADLQAALMQDMPKSTHDTLAQDATSREEKAYQTLYDIERKEGHSSEKAFAAVNKIKATSGGLQNSLLVAGKMRDYFTELDKQMSSIIGLNLEEALGKGNTPVKLAANFANSAPVQKAIIDYQARLSEAERLQSELTAKANQISELRSQQRQALEGLLNELQGVMHKPQLSIAAELQKEAKDLKQLLGFEAEAEQKQKMPRPTHHTTGK